MATPTPQPGYVVLKVVAQDTFLGRDSDPSTWSEARRLKNYESGHPRGSIESVHYMSDKAISDIANDPSLLKAYFGYLGGDPTNYHYIAFHSGLLDKDWLEKDWRDKSTGIQYQHRYRLDLDNFYTQEKEFSWKSLRYNSKDNTPFFTVVSDAEFVSRFVSNLKQIDEKEIAYVLLTKVDLHGTSGHFPIGKGGGYAYEMLSDWETAQQSTLLNDPCIAYIMTEGWFGGVVINGWDTTVSGYVMIDVDPTVRHTGDISSTSGARIGSVYINEAYVRLWHTFVLTGLDAGGAVYMGSGAVSGLTYLDGNLIVAIGGSNSDEGITVNSGQTVYAVNNIIASSTAAGSYPKIEVDATASSYWFWNTFVWRGSAASTNRLIGASSTVNINNILLGDDAVIGAYANDDAINDYNFAEENTTDNLFGTNGAGNQTFTFASASQYTITTDDTHKDSGIAISTYLHPAGIIWPPTTDAFGVERSSPHAIGANDPDGGGGSPTDTPTATPTNTATNTPTSTPTSTPQILVANPIASVTWIVDVSNLITYSANPDEIGSASITVRSSTGAVSVLSATEIWSGTGYFTAPYMGESPNEFFVQVGDADSDNIGSSSQYFQMATVTPTPTHTPTHTSTSTPTNTNTATNTATATNTSTATSTSTPTNTATNTNTPTVTNTVVATNTPTSTPTQYWWDTSYFNAGEDRILSDQIEEPFSKFHIRQFQFEVSALFTDFANPDLYPGQVVRSGTTGEWLISDATSWINWPGLVAGNSNIEIINSGTLTSIIALATDTVRHTSGPITINVSYDAANRTNEVTYEVSVADTAIADVTGKAWVTIQVGNTASLINATDAESLLHIQPTPPIRASMQDIGGVQSMVLWMDTATPVATSTNTPTPTATYTPTPSPTPPLDHRKEEGLALGNDRFKVDFPIIQILQVTYKDVKTTNAAFDYGELIINNDDYIQSGIDEITLQWTPENVNSISGGAVVYKIYIYYLYRPD